MMTAIMGGSIHVTILSMQTYTVHEKGWKKTDLKLALTDTTVSLLGAFGLYCTAIYRYHTLCGDFPEITQRSRLGKGE